MNAKKTLGTALLAAGLTLGPAAAAELWFHVKVDGGKNGEQATINLPLSMVDKLAPIIHGRGRAGGGVRIDDRDYSVAELRRIWGELENGPDATYVTVNEPDSKARVAKRGGYLVMEATDRSDGGDVQARIPLAVVRALLSGSGEELDVAAALEALARHGEGELVTVSGEDETVRIWVDGAPEAR
ncbi:MAG TPA: hypothetical protein VGX68_04000 [Thermoanaerobaculia bacterium]|jgi:hypothetical protein|nr:hypothetical protein [Thermoanaerobaculia bacterium]